MRKDAREKLEAVKQKISQLSLPTRFSNNTEASEIIKKIQEKVLNKSWKIYLIIFFVIKNSARKTD
jgi:hypothetical protein